jgi:MoaA/NifB/PqqE/SkfB family radical SAM enzyme
MTPAQYDEVLASLYRIERKYERRMLVNAKCAPHSIKTVLEHAGGGPEPIATDGESASTPADPAQGTPSWPGLSRIRVYPGGAGGCPAGTHHMGIRPNEDVTPYPYLPVFAGSLRHASLNDLWTSSELFAGIRRRASLGGRCGACEMNARCGGAGPEPTG